MPEYHGDIMYKMGNIYTRSDDRNYPAAIILALLLGPIGVHRFFLNDMTVAFCYFFPFAFSMFLGVMMLDFTIALWMIGIAYIFIVLEVGYFAYRWVNR